MSETMPKACEQNVRLENDFEMAQRICEELLAGNREAILPIYQRYHSLFLAFVKRRIPDMNDALDLLNDFWAKMLTGEAICSYGARKNATLKTYLTSILHKRIADWYRRSKRDKDRKVIPISGDVENSGIQSHESMAFSPEAEPDALLQNPGDLAGRVVNEALDTLSRTHPRDALLIRMQLKSMPHEEKARHLLIAEGKSSYSPDDLKRKTNAIKKQWSRPEGTWHRFELIVKRIMERDGLEPKDFNR